jgi:hypothetical protein
MVWALSLAARTRCAFLRSHSAFQRGRSGQRLIDLQCRRQLLVRFGHIENPACRRIVRGTVKPRALPVHPWSEHHGRSRGRSGGAQIFGGRLAGAAVCDDIEADGLSLIEGAHAGAFERADMNKHVTSAIGGLNEAKALLVIKPLHDSRIHRRYPLIDNVHVRPERREIGTLSVDRFLEKGV